MEFVLFLAALMAYLPFRGHPILFLLMLLAVLEIIYL